MNKRNWLIPILIVTINVLAIAVRWSSLSELLPAHFDLQGNAGGHMSRNTLLMYPLIGAAICLVMSMIARIKPTILEMALVILSSGISLVLLLSTLVTLTNGTMSIFMLAEPVILLAAAVSAVVCILKSVPKKDHVS